MNIYHFKAKESWSGGSIDVIIVRATSKDKAIKIAKRKLTWFNPDNYSVEEYEQDEECIIVIQE